VPDEPAARAQLAHALAARHRLVRDRVPGIRSALDLDGGAVRGAYAAQFGAPLDEVFAARVPIGERLRWAAHGLVTSLDRLPPFWLTVVMTVTVSLPGSMLGLPVAATAMGPLPALALLGLVGLVMSIAMAGLGEGIARSGGVRYRHAFLGGMATALIGNRASVVFTTTGGFRSGLSLLAGWIGLSITVAEVTHTPRGLWAGVILAAVILMLARGSKLALATVALVGVLTTVLVVLVALVALLHDGPGDLSHADVPLGDGVEALDKTVGAALGVILMQYIGSVYLVGIQRQAAERDPDASTLAAGAFVGTVIVTVIVGFWLVGVSAAVPAADLAGTKGTAVGPLADQVGPAMGVLGGLASVLLLGISINRASIAVHALTLERLTRWSGRWRTVLALVPVLLIFAVALGDASFSSVLTIAGVVTNVLVGIAIPMLIVMAARRRGELVPPRVWPWVGWPGLAWALVAASLAALVVVGLFVWDDWASRGAALTMAVLGAVTMVWAVRSGALRRRTVVELLPGRWAVVASGRPLAVDAELEYDGRRAERIHAAGGSVAEGLRELRVWCGAASGADATDVWKAEADVATKVVVIDRKEREAGGGGVGGRG
jgi:hypothetical protein